jgi:lysylphosphatidylglycerol synthetase-like protein (DUF2156 family)
VPGLGSQPYVTAKAYGRAIAVGIGDPLAAPRDWPALAAAFKAALPHASFMHVGPAYARVLQERLGFAIADMGAETNILVRAWGYGKRTRTIRTAARDARSAGVRVREVGPAGLTPHVGRQLADVTGAWVVQAVAPWASCAGLGALSQAAHAHGGC